MAGLAVLVMALVGSGIGPPCGLLPSPAPTHRCSCCPAGQPCGCCTGSPAPADHERPGQPAPRASLAAPPPALLLHLAAAALPAAAFETGLATEPRELAVPPPFLTGHAFRC
ncbi:MAG TPA: hypothetical protein P5234_08600 [Thermoanaerobaculaceae bacterium]|nr:hypothetical protein [Thermoanaerobaculaceae bacterium]HRS16290.1 hypothetical protein [Thermoanaerobaculaceae bacterium]